MNFNDFETAVYATNGTYQVHIRNKRNSHHNWNYRKLKEAYPIELAVLHAVGFTNESRDLYGRGLGISHTQPTYEQALVVKAAYDRILAGLLK